MKRFALLALPAFVVGTAVGAAAVVIYRRRSGLRSSPRVLQYRTSAAPDTRATATAGTEPLAGHDERHEEELEARHGAVLHIDVGKLNVGQI
jgi:hypothetical protein